MSELWWLNGALEADTYVAFRGHVTTQAEGPVNLTFFGATTYNLWVDGKFWREGPARYPASHPEYDHGEVYLAAGHHVLTGLVHYIGHTTEPYPDILPFWTGTVTQSGQTLPIKWKCQRMRGFRNQFRKLRSDQTWVTWWDTSVDPDDWQSVDFCDNDWEQPVAVERELGTPQPLSSQPVRRIVHPVSPIARGVWCNTFGMLDHDDYAARFFLRDLTSHNIPPEGVWRRYDLRQVRLGRPRMVLDLPAGARVEIALSEQLIHDRVHPWINLCHGMSCNLDTFVARGGVQEFWSPDPKGGRFMEVHVQAAPEAVRFLAEEFMERAYFGESLGEFSCEDPLINQIWQTGIASLRSCAEDAITDNPTRERGQWTGDVVSVAMDIAGVAFDDLALLRRALIQEAACARADGLVAGLCPGVTCYLSTFAALWWSACVHYYELTGEQSLLDELFPAAIKNLSAFQQFSTDQGLVIPPPPHEGLGFHFVDWGYIPPEGPSDMGLNLFFLWGIRSLARWCQILGKTDELDTVTKLKEQYENLVDNWLVEKISASDESWESIGYHCTALALRLKKIPSQHVSAAIKAIHRHLMNCFPNNPVAPRNEGYQRVDTQLITPYFAHYVFPGLIEHGSMEMVLDQMRRCWGWALEDGRTTWVEVFDTRWSHCHQWSGCPTWQLSRYVLGLHTRFDIGMNTFMFNLCPGYLKQAQGRLPIGNSGATVWVEWHRQEDLFDYHIETPCPITVLGLPGAGGESKVVEKEFSCQLPVSALLG